SNIIFITQPLSFHGSSARALPVKPASLLIQILFLELGILLFFPPTLQLFITGIAIVVLAIYEDCTTCSSIYSTTVNKRDALLVIARGLLAKAFRSRWRIRNATVSRTNRN